MSRGCGAYLELGEDARVTCQSRRMRHKRHWGAVEQRIGHGRGMPSTWMVNPILKPILIWRSVTR